MRQTCAAMIVFLGIWILFDGVPTLAQTVGSKIQDCEICPVMIVLPSGKYRMGDLAGTGLHNEKPAHSVIIARPFAIGIHEITYSEFDACVSEGGCKHSPNDGNWGRGKRAVASVSWNDAVQYVEWLSGKTGQVYRLLTEAEWEYAARAGSETLYPWGNELGKGNAACLSCGAGSVMTIEAGKLPPNAFGLHDMVASRKEWVQDCWNRSYEGAPTNGSAWTVGQCERRVLRGGSWYDGARFIRSASRAGAVMQEREDQYGFRVARELKP